MKSRCNFASRLLVGLVFLGVQLHGEAAIAADPQWESLGPMPLNAGPYTGRVSAIAPHPTNADVLYIGAATGGVWKLDGDTWTPLTETMRSMAIGAIAVATSDPDVIYAGSGEANYALHSFYGLGLYRSKDGGKTWEILGEEEFAGRTFSRILVNPKDADDIWAATMHSGGFPARSAAKLHPRMDDPVGIWHSTDGGKQWERIVNGLPDDVAMSDLAWSQDDPSTLYAAAGDPFGHPDNGIYKTTDGAKTWKKLSGGLPAQVGRISLGVAQSDGDVVYALTTKESSASGEGASTIGFFRSDDGGSSWTSRSSQGIQSSYGWYLSTVAVDPTDPDRAVAGGVSAIATRNGGSSFGDITPPHVDLHAFVFDAKGRLLIGDDGGIHRSDDLGDNWQPIHSNLSIVQIYAGLAYSSSDPNYFVAGMQDNGSNRRDGSSLGWAQIGGGDGGQTANHPDNPKTVIYQSQNLALSRITENGSSGISGISNGDRNAFFSPVVFAGSNPSRVYLGTQRVYKSDDSGANFTAVSDDLSQGGALRALAVAPSDEDVVYAVSNDGNVAVSKQGGSNFEIVLDDHPGQLRTTREIAVDPKDPGTAFLAFPAFGGPKLRMTKDYGSTWQDISGNLPDIPANAVAVLEADTASDRALLLGTDAGLFVSCDMGTNWRPWQGNLPTTHISEVVGDLGNERILLLTMGRGAWSSPIPAWNEEGGACAIADDDTGTGSDESTSDETSTSLGSSDSTSDSHSMTHETSSTGDSSDATSSISGDATGSGSKGNDSASNSGESSSDSGSPIDGKAGGCSCNSKGNAPAFWTLGFGALLALGRGQRRARQRRPNPTS